MTFLRYRLELASQDDYETLALRRILRGKEAVVSEVRVMPTIESVLEAVAYELRDDLPRREQQRADIITYSRFSKDETVVLLTLLEDAILDSRADASMGATLRKRTINDLGEIARKLDPTFDVDATA